MLLMKNWDNLLQNLVRLFLWKYLLEKGVVLYNSLIGSSDCPLYVLVLIYLCWKKNYLGFWKPASFFLRVPFLLLCCCESLWKCLITFRAAFIYIFFFFWNCCFSWSSIINFLKKILFCSESPSRPSILYLFLCTRSSAEEAIQRLNGTVIGKQTVRLSWGRTPVNKQVIPSTTKSVIELIFTMS